VGRRRMVESGQRHRNLFRSVNALAFVAATCTPADLSTPSAVWWRITSRNGMDLPGLTWIPARVPAF
jgi:hypothetical protein